METKIISLKKDQINTIKDLISPENNVNLILDIRDLDVSTEKLEEIFQFMQLNKHSGTTFVVVKEYVDLDTFSEEWNIVPTIQEAEDLISLDEMMRDLE